MSVYALPQRLPPPKPGPVARTLDFIAGGDKIVSNVPIKSYDPSAGGFVVTLPDGQVWKQTDDQNRFVRWKNSAEAHRVTIWKGALNTFNLGFDTETDRYKVRRLK